MLVNFAKSKQNSKEATANKQTNKQTKHWQQNAAAWPCKSYFLANAINYDHWQLITIHLSTRVGQKLASSLLAIAVAHSHADLEYVFATLFICSLFMLAFNAKFMLNLQHKSNFSFI